MAVLVAGDMTKNASSGQYAGSSRPDIFQRKIDDKRPFIIGKDKGGKVVNGIRYDEKKKTLSYYVGNKKSVVTTVAYTKVFKEVRIAVGPAEWVATDVYIKSANILFEKFGNKMKAPVYFHRGSRFMENLYEAKKATHKLDKKSGAQQAPGSFSNDKWNPGDIWASTTPPLSTPLQENTSSWGELNAEVYRLASKGMLLGISLKKVKKDSKAKLTEYGSPNTRSKRESYKYNGFTFGQTGEFFNSQDIYMHTNVGDVQFRTFSGETAWQGEVKGGAAAGGKIGGGNVDFYTREVFGRDKGIYKGLGTERQLVQWIQSHQDGEYQELLYDLYKKHNSKSKPSKKILSEEDFYAELAEKDFKFKNSKLISMLFLDRLESASAKKKDEFATKLFRYAQSDVDQSSYFVKVY